MSGPGHGWYRGDVVTFADEPARNYGIIRELAGERAKVQLGDDWTWLPTDDLAWTGCVIAERLPCTSRGWRKLWRRFDASGAAALDRTWP